MSVRFGMTQEILEAAAARTHSAISHADGRWSAACAVVGAALWFAAPVVAPLSFGSVEHTFLFLPLVAAPIALCLLSMLIEPASPRRARALHLVRRAQPFAAAMLLISFLVSKGPLAGALALGWTLVAVSLAWAGAGPALRLHDGRHLAKVSLLAAHVFLPIGGVWLLLSRLGIAPPRFEHSTVFLAALHFHFSGFILQILIGATGLLLPERGRWLPSLHRVAALAAVAGIPIIAAGNIAHVAILKFFGVSAMVVSSMGLAITSTMVAMEVPNRRSRRLLFASAASLVAAMVLAAIYGVGEVTGRSFISVAGIQLLRFARPHPRTRRRWQVGATLIQLSVRKRRC